MNGYYNISTPACAECHYSCLTCVTASTTCLSCPGGSNRYNYSGLNNTCPCVNGFFDNGITICEACHYTCA